MVYLIAAISAITGFLFGYDEGIISGTLHLLIKDFSMNHVQTGIVTSALPFGAIFGSIVLGFLLAGRYSQRIGRKPLLFVVASLYTLGGLVVSVAPNMAIIIFARVILGLAIGAGAVIAPLYISETAPANIRGRLITIYQLAITLGILISFITNYLLIEWVSWRIIYATVILPSIVLFVGVFFVPESPRWLVFKGEGKRALQILKRIRKGVALREINDEFTAITKVVEAEKPARWTELFTQVNRPLVIVGVVLFMFQQLSGINTVIYYAPSIFAQTGFESLSSQILATVLIGVVNVISTLLAMSLVERLGRFHLLALGFTGASISLAVIFIGSLVQFPYMNWLSLLALISYIVFFAISIGPLPWVIMSEIFPLNIRGAGMGLSSVSNWFFNTVVVLLFPIFAATLGVSNTFGIFSLLCILGLIFTLRYIPETKGISLEAIEEYINLGKPLNQLGKQAE